MTAMWDQRPGARLHVNRCVIEGCGALALDGPFCEKCDEQRCELLRMATLEDRRWERGVRLERARAAARRWLFWLARMALACLLGAALGVIVIFAIWGFLL